MSWTSKPKKQMILEKENSCLLYIVNTNFLQQRLSLYRAKAISHYMYWWINVTKNQGVKKHFDPQEDSW